jgi:hypothetical protein
MWTRKTSESFAVRSRTCLQPFRNTFCWRRLRSKPYRKLGSTLSVPEKRATPSAARYECYNYAFVRAVEQSKGPSRPVPLHYIARTPSLFFGRQDSLTSGNGASTQPTPVVTALEISFFWGTLHSRPSSTHCAPSSFVLFEFFTIKCSPHTMCGPTAYFSIQATPPRPTSGNW